MSTEQNPSSSSSPPVKPTPEGGKGKSELPRELPPFPAPTSGGSGDSGNPTTNK
jgi:hypothetical protein